MLLHCFRVRQRLRFQTFVILIFNGKIGYASEPNDALRAVFSREPEVTDLRVAVLNLGFLNPEGRVSPALLRFALLQNPWHQPRSFPDKEIYFWSWA